MRRLTRIAVGQIRPANRRLGRAGDGTALRINENTAPGSTQFSQLDCKHIGHHRTHHAVDGY
jgi:hypothetical protein